MAPELGRRLLLGTIVAGSAAIVAVAQPTVGRGPGMMGGGMGPGMMGGYWNTASYLDGLKTRLGITAGQEPVWKDYSDTVTGVGEQMQALHQTMFEAMGTASWQERRNLMDSMFQTRQQASDTVHQAAIKLVAALAPAQKERAQQILPGLAYGHGMMMR
ncbi:MAG TPA: Spy/CpxP family protein refolding chaperone [Acetobacteraceae bacterium]|nr:Spy/CpxP family protein refolding chaperone [Acetobacteraceae bacterium]